MKRLGLLLGLSTLCLGYASLALADQQLNMNIPGGGAQDLLNMTSVPTAISDGTHDSSVTRSCTTPHGRVVREEEQGYSECMALLNGKKIQPSPVPASNAN